MHGSHVVCPVLPAKVPAAQLAQAEDLGAFWKEPVAQLLQDVAVPSEKVPAAQLEQLVLPVPSWNSPALQFVHVDMPLALWKVPAWHGVHEVTKRPWEMEPATQAVHTFCSL